MTAPTVRDFEARTRAPTIVISPHATPTVQSPGAQSPGVQSPGVQSPGSVNSPKLQRTSSATSALSLPGSIDTTTARFRKLSRTNTVTAYDEHAIDSGRYKPGAEPGVDTAAEDDQIPGHLTNIQAPCEINIIDFSDEQVQHIKCDNASLASCLETPRGEQFPCRWISVNGLSFDVVRILGNKFNLHRLAVEDLLHTKTRTKVDWYAEHAFIVLTLQRLVRLHQHTGKGEKCGCDEGLSREDCKDINEKFESHSQRRRGTGLRSLMNWFLPRDNQPEGLPRYLDRNRDGKMDEFVNAHSGLSEDAPIMPIRTLHRYESAQIPSHTAWMEQHSALAQEDLTVSVEQVSIFLLSDNSVISFFEQSADAVEFPILERLHSKETMLRRSCDASLLTQAIIDTIVDLAVPVKEAYNKSRKELQIDAMTNPDIRTSRALHIFGEEIDMLQNLFKPIVHLVNSLRDHNNEGPATVSNGAPPPMSSTPPDGEPELKPNVNRRNREGTPVATRSYSEFRMKALSKSANATSVTITPLAHTYFGDVLDHCITMISALEQMDASANNISTLIFNTVGARTNNFMMILAVVTVFFAPLTFISGYFGMNMSSGAGLAHPFSFFWVVAVPSLAGFMLLVFGAMLWDNISNWLANRGVKARWKIRSHHRPGRR